MFTSQEIRLATFIGEWTGDAVAIVLEGVADLPPAERLAHLKDEVQMFEARQWFADNCED
jgi:hypothetical protein